MKALIAEGKVRAFGLSEVGAATLRRAQAEQPVAAVQNEYSIWTRDPEGEVLAACEELGVGLVAWGPLGKGYLTGTVPSTATFRPEDLRSTMPRFTQEAMEANRPVIALLTRVAERKQVTPGQVALAWLLANKPWIVPIPGTTRISHLEENVQAMALELPANDMQEIDRGFAAITVHGARSSDAVLKLIDDGAKLGTSSRGGHGLSRLRGTGARHDGAAFVSPGLGRDRSLGVCSWAATERQLETGCRDGPPPWGAPGFVPRARLYEHE